MSEKVIYEIGLKDGLSAGLSAATGKAQGLDKAVGGINNGLKKGSSSIGGFTAGLKNMIGPLVGVAAAYKAIAIASDSIREAREFESLENAIRFASGSAEEGAKSLKFIGQTANALGLDLKSTTEGFKTFSGSMLGTALAGDPAKKIFGQVSMAASAMGLSAEQTKGTFIALGQIMGKGKVQAEELRGQLGERIPGAFNIAARAMGVTTAELDKMMEQGQLVATDFLPKFGDELQKTFGPGLKDSVNSSAAQFNRFNNSILKLKLSFGRAVLPLLNTVLTGFQKLTGWFSANKSVIIQSVSPLIDLFTNLKNAWLETFKQFLGGTSWTEKLTNAFNVLYKVLTFLRPAFDAIVLVIKTTWTLQAALIKGIFSLADRFPTLVKAFNGTVMALRQLLIILANRFADTFGSIGDMIEGALSADFSKIKEGVKGLAESSFINPLRAKKEAEQIGAAFREGYNNGLGLGGLDFSGIGKKETSLNEYMKGLGALGNAGASGSSAAGGSGGKKSSTTVDDIKSGRPTHINIDIGKLVETMNITSMGIDDLTGQVKDAVAKVLVSAVSNVNNIR